MTENRQAHRPGTKGSCAPAFLSIIRSPSQFDERDNRYDLYEKKTTENLRRLAALSEERNGITPDMYTEHAVFRGLRDMSGNGVVTGLTEISTIKAKEKETDGTVHSCPGELYYRGYNIRDLVGGFSSENRFGFEEITYLLLFSSLPNIKRSCSCLKKC